MNNVNIKIIVKILVFVVIFFTNYNLAVAEPAKISSRTCYEEAISGVSGDPSQFKIQIEMLCKKFNVIKIETDKIISHSNFTRVDSGYLKILDNIANNITEINKLIDVIVLRNSVSALKETIATLDANLKAMLNISIGLYFDASDSYYRSQQDVGQVGSFLIGSLGYLKILGENKYLNGPDNSPLRLKIIQATVPNTLDESMSLVASCSGGYPISFVQDRSLQSFFDHNEKLLINNNNRLSILDKQGFHVNDNAVFCIAKQGDGYKIYTANDWFLDDNKLEMTRNSGNAGTFVFVSEVNTDQIAMLPTVGNFKIGSHGYIAKKSPITAPEYLNFKPDHNSPVSNHIKFNIVEPLFSKTEQNICDPQQLLTFEVVNDANKIFDKVLSFDEQGLTLVNKAGLTNGITKKKASFCLERIGNYFRIKTLFGSYISNNIVNGLTAMETAAQEFDFTPNFLVTGDLRQGDVGAFKFYDEGFIQSSAKETESKYVAMIKSPDTPNIFEPIKLKVIPPLLKNNASLCPEKNTAVSFEFAHEPGYLLAREEWEFKKISQYQPDADLIATFCIEKIVDHYNIKAAGGYYIDDDGTGFTQDIDVYGSFDFVENIITQRKDNYSNVGPFLDQATGRIKSARDIYFTIKDINNFNYYMPKVKILKSQDISNNYCKDAEPVKIIDMQTSDILTNFYSNLYFINHYMKLPAEMTTFCVRRVQDNYVIFSAFSETSRLYLNPNANSLVPEVNLAEKFVLEHDLPKLLTVNSYQQGDVGLFRINAKGYLKLTDRNIYVNAKQNHEVFNNKEDQALKFKIISPVRNLETEWCFESMAIMLQDNFNPGRVLSFNKNTMDLEFISINDEAHYRNMVFCLENTPNKIGAKIKAFNGKYIDGINANALTNNSKQAGHFTLENNLLDVGLGSVSYMNKAAGKSFMGQFNSTTPVYLKVDHQNKLAITNQAGEAGGFTVVPGLANSSCLSLKDIFTNKFIVYRDKSFFLTDFISSNQYLTLATFCPVLHPLDQTFSFYVANNPQEYFTLSKNQLTTFHSKVLPTDNNSVFIFTNKRELQGKPQNVSQAITNLNCNNLAPLGKIVGRQERTQRCLPLQTLRAKMKNDLEAIDIASQCCSSIGFLYAMGIYTQSGNSDCLIKYDFICVKDDPSLPNSQGNEFLF